MQLNISWELLDVNEGAFLTERPSFHQNSPSYIASQTLFPCFNPAGTTMTVVLVTGPLMTVAKIGDSAAVLDTGCSMLELTASHRVQDNVPERKRMLAAGSQVAQVRGQGRRIVEGRLKGRCSWAGRRQCIVCYPVWKTEGPLVSSCPSPSVGLPP